MQCLWPSTKATSRTALAAVVSSAALTGVLAWSAVASPSPSRVMPNRVPITQLEKTLRRVPAHISEFAPVSQPLALAKCGNVRPPEALLTPDPLLHAQDDDMNVRVSIIVVSDAHIPRSFVFNSGGP